MSVEQMFREKTKQELRNRNSLPTFPTDATIWHQTGLCFVLLNNTVIRPLLFQVGVILTDWDAFLCVCHWFHTILQRFQFFTSSMWSLSWMYVSSYQGAFFRVYVIHRWVASMLVAVNSCDVLAYRERLFDVLRWSCSFMETVILKILSWTITTSARWLTHREWIVIASFVAWDREYLIEWSLSSWNDYEH